jgi:hypothetical protein
MKIFADAFVAGVAIGVAIGFGMVFSYWVIVDLFGFHLLPMIG